MSLFKSGVRFSAYVLVAAFACGAILSCGDEEEVPPTCIPGSGYELSDGTCAGLPSLSICGDTYCEDARETCAHKYYVSWSATPGGSGTMGAPLAKLADAAAVAASGDCVLVSAGSYGAASFKGGVNLLGAGAGSVTITPGSGKTRGLEITGGSGGLVRGVRVNGPGGGIHVDGTAGLRIEQVHVNGATGAGIYAGAAKNLSLKQVTVSGTGLGKIGKETITRAMGIVLTKGTSAKITRLLGLKSAQIGLYAVDSTVDISSSALVQNGKGADESSRGLVITCSSVSSCKALGKSTLTTVEVRDNYCVGVSLVGVLADLSGLQVTGTLAATDKTTQQKYANSVQVQAFRTKPFPLSTGQYHSAVVKMTGSTVTGGAGAGIVVEFSSATLNKNLVSTHEDRGIWVQRTADYAGHKVSLEENKVEGNRMVAIGGSQALNVTVKGGTASGTRTKRVIQGGKEMFPADGIMAARTQSSAWRR